MSDYWRVTRIGLALVAGCAVVLAACAGSVDPGVAIETSSVDPTQAAAPSPSDAPGPTPTPFSAPSDAALPTPLPSDAVAEPQATPGLTMPPGTTPFPTPGPTITPGSTRVIGKVLHADGTPAWNVCVVLEKGICPIATDERGIWFTDVPAGPIRWNFIYRVNDREVGRQQVQRTDGGELHLPVFTLTD